MRVQLGAGIRVGFAEAQLESTGIEINWDECRERDECGRTGCVKARCGRVSSEEKNSPTNVYGSRGVCCQGCQMTRAEIPVRVRGSACKAPQEVFLGL